MCVFYAIAARVFIFASIFFSVNFLIMERSEVRDLSDTSSSSISGSRFPHFFIFMLLLLFVYV